MSTCPVKRVFKFLNHLATFAGFPVPHGVKWIDGKPDFRQVDEDRWLEAAQKKLCGVCGKRLGEYAWYIGGDGCYSRRSSTFRCTDLARRPRWKSAHS